jgi:two-component system chemotaxis response regulator CheB
MVVVKQGGEVVTRLSDDPPENSCRPSVDVLFRSVAEVYGQHALGVVLTGMGHDGLRGSELICSRGGTVLVQDESSSVVWGMAGAVARAGLAAATLPLDQLAAAIVRRIQYARPSWNCSGNSTRASDSSPSPLRPCR